MGAVRVVSVNDRRVAIAKQYSAGKEKIKGGVNHEEKKQSAKTLSSHQPGGYGVTGSLKRKTATARIRESALADCKQYQRPSENSRGS